MKKPELTIVWTWLAIAGLWFLDAPIWLMIIALVIGSVIRQRQIKEENERNKKEWAMWMTHR